MRLSSFSRITFLSILGLLLLLFLGERLLSGWLEKRLTLKTNSAGIDVQDLNVSLVGRSVRARGVQWTATGSPQDSTSITADEVHIKGIGIFHFLRNKSIRMRSVIISGATINLGTSRRDSTRKIDSLITLNGVEIGTLRVLNTTVTWRRDSLTTWSARTDITLSRVLLKDRGDPSELSSYEIAGDVEILLNKVTMKEKGGFYSLSIARMIFNRARHTLSCDSLALTPEYPKLTFAHKRGTQSTWAATNIPRIEIRGLGLTLRDSTFTASHILVNQARIEAFRDKRIPLTRRSEVPLPMKWMRELELAVEIDTLQVANMSLQYEHISEDGFEPGKLRFNNMDGTMLNVINRSYNNVAPVTTLVASATVMGHGRIDASFTFPLDAGVEYEAHGQITRLPLSTLNPMLENVAFVSIETGYLNELKFRFRYNNNVSTGTVDVDYEDLKVKGLQKDRQADVNPLKTLLVNTALKNNNSSAGLIQTERDKRRFIFHYWANSIADGLRNAVMPVAGDIASRQDRRKER